MDLTESFRDRFPEAVLERYEFAETRNAATILQATNPETFQELVTVLTDFVLLPTDLTTPGGQESDLASRLNVGFRNQGWREARVDTSNRLLLVTMPYHPAGETAEANLETETLNKGYKVDNFKGRVALDVEWNAKDGNLDRDIGAYRSLYENALIDVGVILSRTQKDLRELGQTLGIAAGMEPERAKKILGTTTTTNIEKLLPRMERGDGGGCPLLAIFICARTMWQDSN